jgi:hypothetical protein
VSWQSDDDIVQTLKAVRQWCLEEECPAHEALQGLVLMGETGMQAYHGARRLLDIHEGAGGPALREARQDRDWTDMFRAPWPEAA